MDWRLRWVVALKPEATPIIEKFGLRHVRETPDLFPVYRSNDGRTELVVSGPGKVSCAAATSFLAARSCPGAVGGWINFGIAGGGQGKYGTAFLGGKIHDRSTGQSWYPPAIVRKTVEPPRVSMETLDRPSAEYPDDGRLIEMEASGFLPVALRGSTAELCQVLKVVSDDAAHPMEVISKSTVVQLCRDGLEQIGPWLEEFREIVSEEANRSAEPPGFEEWSGTLKFSETQRHRLRRLLRQWHSVNRGCDISPQFTPEETKSAQRMLDAFEMKLRGVTATEF